MNKNTQRPHDTGQLMSRNNIGILLLHTEESVYTRFNLYTKYFGNTLVFAQAIEKVSTNALLHAWDVIFVDVNLYNDECIEMINLLKESFPLIKVILLGDSLTQQDRIQYITMGANMILSNYIIKEEFGFITQCLYNNIKYNQPSDHPADCVMFDLITNELSLVGTSVYVEISPQEVAILKLFMLNPLQRLETWQMLDCIGSLDNPRGRKNLEVFVSRLRKKLAPLSPYVNPIQPIRNYGYSLNLHIKIKHYV